MIHDTFAAAAAAAAAATLLSTQNNRERAHITRTPLSGTISIQFIHERTLSGIHCRG